MGLRTLRQQGSSAPREFSPNGETVRITDPDTSVLGSGHFDTAPTGNIAKTVHSLKILRNARFASNTGALLLVMHGLRKFNSFNRYQYYFATLQNLFKIKLGHLLIRLLTDNSQIRLCALSCTKFHAVSWHFALRA